MKKTRWKHIIRGIRGNLNRFLSILFIVALGAGFMAGLAAASPDMYDAADAYIQQYRLFDLDLKSTVGFTEEDMDAVMESMENPSISCMQSARVFDMVLNQQDGSDFTSRVYGMLNDNSETRLNQLNLIEGRLPQSPSECLVESVFGKYSGESIAVGDLLTLAEGNADYDTLASYMTDTTLTVVGICQSPMCLSVEGDSTNIGSGTINLNIYVQERFFTCGFYTDLFLTIEGAEERSTFSDTYTEMLDHVIASLRPLGQERTAIRTEQLKREAQQSIDDASELLHTVNAIASVQEFLREDLSVRTEQTRQIAQLLESSDLAPLLLQTASDAQISSELPLSASELAERISAELSSAQSALDSLTDGSWIFRTRNDLAGIHSYSDNVGKVSALATIFPVFFFIVALLVALTTMSRLIEERRLQIGTLKALGYSGGQILFEYLLFSFCASVFGCILGFGVGFRIFPYAISSAYGMMYTLPPISTPLRWDIIAWVAPVTILSILLAALWSCWSEFRSVPAILMLPKSPAAGKRIWLEHIGFLWHRLSFTYKVTFRNLFRYKKRFIMTIIGVAGCSALLLTGFGIKDSVNDIVDKQFGEVYKYDLLFALDSQDAIQEDPILYESLNSPERITSYTQACQETGKIYYGNEKHELTLFVPENLEAFADFITLKSRTSGELYELSSDSVILTEKMCEEMHIHAGDIVTLEDSSGHLAEVRAAAVSENYVSSFAYLTTDLYRELFHAEPKYTTLMCITPELNRDDVSDTTPASITATILSSSHVLYGRSVSSLKDSFADSIQSINGVIYVLIIAAGLLCMVVLYNLINVNICERKKELATLRVLGFYKRETQNYIFRETNILSFLGALVGLGVGIWLHSFVVRTVEVNHIMFGRDIKPLSYLVSLAISIVFTLVVDLIMKRSINRTDMVEAMKAND